MSTNKRLKLWHWILMISILVITIILAAVLLMHFYSIFTSMTYLRFGYMAVATLICVVILILILLYRSFRK